MNSVELRNQRAGLIAEARKIHDTAKAESRDASAEELDKFDSLMSDADKLKIEIEKSERSEKLDHVEAELRHIPTRKTNPGRIASRSDMSQRDASELMRAWALAGAPGHRPNADVMCRAQEAGVDLTSQVIQYRALSKGTTTAGGFTVPQSFSDQLEKVLGYYFSVAEAFDQFPTETGQDYPYPTVTDTSNAAGIVAEASGIGSSTDPTFGQVTFKSWDYYSPIVKVSWQLLRDSAHDIPALMAELFAERMGRALDAAIISANAGSAAPEGVLTGVSAGVNLAADNLITFAKLLALESSVDLAYRNSPGCAFVMHDYSWQTIRGLVDDVGRPLVNMDLQNGVAKRLLGYPVYISNNMTSIASPTDNSVHILFGDLKRYKIRRVGGSTLTRLNELYAANGQVGFLLHEAFDGRWVTKAGVKTLNAYDSP